VLAVTGAVLMGFYNDAQPNAEELVAQSRAQVYAELDRRYTRLMQQAQAHPTRTEGRNPVPVEFALKREEGSSLELTLTAGWRDIKLHTWLEDGPAPGQTWVRVRFQPESIQQRARESTLLGTVHAVLSRGEGQLRLGQPVQALLGGVPTRRHRDPSRRDPSVHIDPSSTRPMVDVGDDR
jgi:hypothetical protein